ncbi:hypothetical protein A1O1_06200 [Capronia coronata CBS 617.96]|uniref:NADPH-dependent FMN reductase-like domain-containing protein n=1 Tax=Capronia coronata CBS 617.96 TaxID=1182541 RepID=W9Y9D2_9EURO|nr:uncharacterized protein A1O1_06200 [Capronia coronata CBS 617.96]EXJ85831.1 hypothetical protein A1O1_06200 [Capronia coronata CBS 617.96]
MDSTIGSLFRVFPSDPIMEQIGVIICSQRPRRAGPQIATFVLDTLKQYQAGHPSSRPYQFMLIDLAEHPLPMYDEPGIPSRIHSSAGYAHYHTRAWSDLINSFAAFVFVTPQYNWGYPAGLKNALDYLYHEWAGKPAMVVSYGGHGGHKAAMQLKQVLQGLHMKVVPHHVALQFPDREFMERASSGADLGLRVFNEAEPGERLWAQEGKDMHIVFALLLERLFGEADEEFGLRNIEGCACSDAQSHS